MWNCASDYRIGLDAVHTSGFSTPGPENSPMTPIRDVDALLLLATEQLREALLAHRVAAAGAGSNLLVPRPKPAADIKRPGQRQRKPRGVTLRKRSR